MVIIAGAEECSETDILQIAGKHHTVSYSSTVKGRRKVVFKVKTERFVDAPLSYFKFPKSTKPTKG